MLLVKMQGGTDFRITLEVDGFKNMYSMAGKAFLQCLGADFASQGYITICNNHDNRLLAYLRLVQ